MLVPIGLLLGPLRHVHGRAEKPEGSARSPPAPTSRSCASPAVVWLTLLTFLGDVRRLRPDGGRLPGVRPPGQPRSRRGSSGSPSPSTRPSSSGCSSSSCAGSRGKRRTRVLMVMAGLWARGLGGPRADRARPGLRGGRGGGPAVPRACSRSARRCSSRPSPRSPTTWPPTTCAAATTPSAPARSRPGRSWARSWPASCSTTSWSGGLHRDDGQRVPASWCGWPDCWSGGSPRRSTDWPPTRRQASAAGAGTALRRSRPARRGVSWPTVRPHWPDHG